MSDLIIQPKNWSDFQHYKDRSPKWIKLHRGLLDDFEFHCLPLASRALAPMLWLLASEDSKGLVTCNWKKLAFRLRCQVDEIEGAVKSLIEGGFFIVVQDASNTLAEQERDASLEKSKSRVREEEEREESESGASAPDGDVPPPTVETITKTVLVNDFSVKPQVAADYLKVRKAKRSPLTPTAWEALINEFSKAGLSVPDGVRVCVERGWVGFKASWDWKDPEQTNSHSGFDGREYTDHIPAWAQEGGA